MSRNEELLIAAALSGLCQHSAAKAHYDVDELGARAVSIGRSAAKAYAEATKNANDKLSAISVNFTGSLQDFASFQEQMTKFLREEFSGEPETDTKPTKPTKPQR